MIWFTESRFISSGRMKYEELLQWALDHKA